MNTPVQEKDTLEKIVEEAIAREQGLNAQHPERHGYGMIEGEADDLIKRIELLEFKLERAQKEKARTRKEKIRLIGRDKLYTKSPEDIIVEDIMRSKFNAFEESTRDKMSNRTRQVYDLNDIGKKQIDIAKELGVSQPTVHRELNTAKKIIEDSYEKWRDTLDW